MVEGVSIHRVGQRTLVLQYADDVILFLRWSDDMNVWLRRCLHIFSITSGIRTNLHKGVMVVVGMDQEEIHQLTSSLGWQFGSLPMKYLGLHHGSRKRDIQSWNHVWCW